MKSTAHTLSASVIGKKISIDIATTLEERNEIYRLRYKIYADEIAYHLIDVDHKNQLLYDEMDEWAMLLYIRFGSAIIGTGRINFGKIADFSPDVAQAYSMDKFLKFHKNETTSNFAVISKGMISPYYRSSSSLTLLMTKIYELYCDYQIQFAFVNCNFHLVPLHEHFGSRRIDKNILDPNIGPMASLVMLVDDIQYLRTANSPLFHIARKRTSFNNTVADWFHSEFSHEISNTVNSQLVAPDKLWNIITQYLGAMPHHLLPILRDLSLLESMLFLHYCSTIVHCHPGDYITAGSNASQELIILLSGTAHSPSQGMILPGQYCGENGLVNRTTHLSSVIAVNDVHILVLSFHYFKKFYKSHPAIAMRIINNLENN